MTTIKSKQPNQFDKVLSHLLTRGKITSVEAFGLYGITRISAVIFNIRAKFGNEYVQSKRKQGVNASYVEYRLDAG